MRIGRHDGQLNINIQLPRQQIQEGAQQSVQKLPLQQSSAQPQLDQGIKGGTAFKNYALRTCAITYYNAVYNWDSPRPPFLGLLGDFLSRIGIFG